MNKANEFIKLNDVECQAKFRITAEWLYVSYYDKIYKYLSLITRYQNMDKPLTQKEMRILFGVSHSVWKGSKYYFSELKDILSHKRDMMKAKSERDLVIGIEIAPANPKLLEMQLQMYNDDWKPKGTQVEINLPDVIAITVEDLSVNEDELDDDYKTKRIEVK